MGRTAVILALVASLLVATIGCTRQVTGTAQPDPNRPPVVIVEDGFGIKIGFADAPVQLEIYTEPQCNHCADLQADFGEQLRHYIAMGQTRGHLPAPDVPGHRRQPALRSRRQRHVRRGHPGGGEEHVTATTPSRSSTSSRRPGRQYAAGADHPTTDELAEMARTAGIPEDIAARIGSGEPAVDTKDMQDTNFEFLYLIDPSTPGPRRPTT